jgi:CRISPR-associated protein Csx14
MNALFGRSPGRHHFKAFIQAGNVPAELMKTAVIAPMGFSPPVITQFIDGIGEPVSDLVILATSHPEIRAGIQLVNAAIQRRYPWLRIHISELDCEDISTNDQNFSFMKKAVRLIREEREYHHCDTIYLNVAGGRKNMCITLSLVGQLLNVDGIFHVVSRNVEIINQRLEFLRKDIARFGGITDPGGLAAAYDEKAQDYDALLFPDRQTYDIIRIPTLPYPIDYLGYLVSGMREQGAGLTGEDKNLLVRHGMIDRIGSSCDVTRHGEQFLEVLLSR